MLEFKVQEFISTRKSKSITDMLTRQESNTFNIMYKPTSEKKYIKLQNAVFYTKEEAENFIENVLKVNSILYYKEVRFRNGIKEYLAK